MQALGLIETRGLISAIECADAMLKAADVTLLDKTQVGGGLVSIAVTGGVAAVTASVEAGVAAVNQINATLLVSSHVIPRPHDELDNLIMPIKPRRNLQSQTFEEIEDKPLSVVTNRATDRRTEDLVEEVLKSAEKVSAEKVSEDKALEDKALEDKALEEAVIKELPEVKENVSLDINLDKINKAIIDKLVLENSLEKALEVLSSLKVIKLRNLAREYKNMMLSGRKISNADKKMLLEEFRKYYSNNR